MAPKPDYAYLSDLKYGKDSTEGQAGQSSVTVREASENKSASLILSYE
jgi:hypothetical protein